MITEKFAQTLKTKIAIKNFDRRSEPEMKKQLYKLIEEELANFKEEEKKKDNKIKELKSKIKEAEEQVEKAKKIVFQACHETCQIIREDYGTEDKPELENLLRTIEASELFNEFMLGIARNLNMSFQRNGWQPRIRRLGKKGSKNEFEV